MTTDTVAQAIVAAGETGYLSCAETAKLIRRDLREAFPGVKFSVRSDTYSGGASIDIRWTDGPRTAKVEPITERYQGAGFDGMGWVGDNFSPGIPFCGTGVSTMGQMGSPVSRLKVNRRPCLVNWASALTGFPSTVMSIKLGAAGGSQSQTG